MKPLDLSKFRKSITSKIEGISTGFHDPKTWLNTGNYALNYLISGQFTRGVPLSQITMLAGESGSGKSLIAANVMREALEAGMIVVAFDSENGLTKEWLKRAGIEVDKYQNQFMRIQVALIDDVAQAIYSFVDGYIKDYKDVDPDERPKVLFVIDSLGMLLTRTDMDQFSKGDLKGDMGRKPKALNSLVRNCVVKFAEYDIGLLATNHTYASQDMFDPDDKISGGGGFIYAASIVIAMRKLKLKVDEDGAKGTAVHGIRAAVKVNKTRYGKPFESVEIRIPYESGIDPYSGLLDLFEKQGLITKDGNGFVYVDMKGVSHKLSGKALGRTSVGLNRPSDEGAVLLDLVMAEHTQKYKPRESHDTQDIINEFEVVVE